MTLDSIVNLVTRLFLRKAVGYAVNKGVELASRRAGPATPPAGGAPPTAQAEQARIARETAKRARKAAQLTRRLGR